MDNLYKSVLSLEKCKYLLTLLADNQIQDSSGPTNNFLVTKTNVEVYEDLNFVEQIIPAFTIIDLLDFLPKYVEKEGVKYYLNTQEFNKRWNITYRNVDSIRYLYYNEDKSLLDCLYNCLLWKLIVYDHKDI